MKSIDIKAIKRETFGKKESKAIRREGMVPATLIGNGETLHFSVDVKALKPLIYTPNAYIVHFDLDGKTEKGVMREVQFHPTNDQVLHVEFYHVAEGKPIAIDIPVKVVGNSAGVKQGGKLAIIKRKIRVSALEKDLPDFLTIDVTPVELGKSVFVGDLNFDGLTLLTSASTAVLAVKMTRAARGAAAAAAAEEAASGDAGAEEAAE